MSIFRSEPLRIRSWSPRSAALSWRLYDFQLTTYAILLVLFGLAMAYSNSVGTTHTTLSPWLPVRPRVDVDGHCTRGFHRGHDVRLPLAPHLRLAHLLHQRGPLDPHPALRHQYWRRWHLGSMDRRGGFPIPVQRARQDPDDHRLRRVPGAAGRRRSSRFGR